MLKVSHDELERQGAASLAYWAGEGAADVYERDGAALLMQRATGSASLMAMATQGQDDEASQIACRVIAALHAPRARAWPDALVPLARWFQSLEHAADREGGLFARAMEQAHVLLEGAEAARPLHGDIHHDNVLDFGARG